MKLALAQRYPSGGDIARTLAEVADLARGLAGLGADLLILPELVLPGYNLPHLHGTLAQGMGGDWIRRMRAIAVETGVALVFGWAERDGRDVYNSATAIGGDGAILAHYRKIQLFGTMEATSFRAGDAAPPVFDLAGRKLGLLICYDIEFPQHAAALAARGADLIVVPTANPAGFDHVPQTLVPARAYENRLTIAYANYCGVDAGLEFGGLSVVVGPDGQGVARAGRGEAVLVVDLPAPARYAEGGDLGQGLSTQAHDYRPL